MIGDRVRWAHLTPKGEPLFPERGGIVRAVNYVNEQWRVLVQHDDGTYSGELASNLAAVEPGSSTDVLERELAATRSELAARREAVARLADYITGEGLVEDAPEPCAAAIELLRTFQAELVEVGAARDAATARLAEVADERDASFAREQAAGEEVGRLAAELEAAKKRKRPPGRSSEDSP